MFNDVCSSVDRRSFEGEYKIDSDGRPLNPKGRTGISGRGYGVYLSYLLLYKIVRLSVPIESSR